MDTLASMRKCKRSEGLSFHALLSEGVERFEVARV
jgi:hypothetical protein